MKQIRTFIAALALAAPLGLVAQTGTPTKTSPAKMAPKEQAHRDSDIARHRQMAKAHEEAARCLEAGTPEKQCHQQLREACKGLGVGQYCGMRHAH